MIIAASALTEWNPKARLVNARTSRLVVTFGVVVVDLQLERGEDPVTVLADGALEFDHPEHAQLISRVLAIDTKRGDHSIVTYLTPDEAETLLAAPDPATPIGRRRPRCLAVPATREVVIAAREVVIAAREVVMAAVMAAHGEALA